MANEKILVIDDEKEFLDLMKNRLMQEGYSIVTAQEGNEGIERAKKENPDLVICDIKMPGKSGYAVLKEIRKNVDKFLPVIIVSVLSAYDNIKEAYDDEADFYISKPVEMVALSRNIRTILNLSRNKRSA